MTFLQQVAQDLLDKFGNDLSKITVVFPNRRARLFFNEYLVQLSEEAIWAPKYAGIDELFKENCTLSSADPLYLLTELYNAYQEVYEKKNGNKSAESFDEFFYFGEILLNDFNDIDKNLVNDLALFSNLSDLDALKDDFEHLDEGQRKSIERFFDHKIENQTELKEAFFSIWNMLGDVYCLFKENLSHQHIAYDGMIFREVIENLENNSSSFDQEKYAFVGFNVLTECERRLFKELKRNDQALFYWDYDKYYMQKAHEAGRFMHENLQQFKNELEDKREDTFISSKKTVILVESSSESAQAGYIEQFLQDVSYQEKDEIPDTALVLCNEQNLQAIMHTLPASIDNKVITANITMGFPLNQTPVFSFVTALTELQQKGLCDNDQQFRYKYVLPVLRHPYTRLIFPEAIQVQSDIVKNNIFFPNKEELINKELFLSCKNSLEISSYLINAIKILASKFEEQKEENDGFSQLYSEAIFRTFENLNRLHDLIKEGKLQIEKNTYLALLKRLLSSTSIPFHGEPARGLQIMGVLETRNMDFKNLMMMSTNEGVFPKTDTDNSFIPHFIRRFFKMTTVEHQDSLYAYYFYRLLQRAENVSLVYNTANTPTGKMEKSRYILQLLTESGLAIQQVRLKTEMSPQKEINFTVKKTPILLEKIKQAYDLHTNPEARKLSPTAINNFIDCSLRFYLQYIMEYKPPKEISDEMDNSILGSVFHKAIEIIYANIGKVKIGSDFPAFTVEKDKIETFLKLPKMIENAIEIAFNEELFGNRKVSRDNYNGEQLVYFDVAKQFIKKVLKNDLERAPFHILGLEKKVQQIMELKDIQLSIRGTIDRLDEKDEIVRVVDYKTGGNPADCSNMSALFKAAQKRPNYILQAFIYSAIESEQQSSPIVPALFYVHKASDTNYSPIINYNKTPITNFLELKDEFIEKFQEKLIELFNPEIPFEQTTVKDNCKWCDFKDLCGK